MQSIAIEKDNNLNLDGQGREARKRRFYGH